MAPAGTVTRPTADRVREALFSMLASRLGSFEDLQVVDIFAGSGALGLEALSRGAAHGFFIDSDRAAAEAIRRNIASWALRRRCCRTREICPSTAGGPRLPRSALWQRMAPPGRRDAVVRGMGARRDALTNGGGWKA